MFDLIVLECLPHRAAGKQSLTPDVGLQGSGKGVWRARKSHTEAGRT